MYKLQISSMSPGNRLIHKMLTPAELGDILRMRIIKVGVATTGPRSL